MTIESVPAAEGLDLSKKCIIKFIWYPMHETSF